MNLVKLLTRKSLVVIGINSGTSADGVDVAALRISRRPKRVHVRFLKGVSGPYPRSLRAEILKTMDTPHTDIDRLIRLDLALGRLFAGRADRMIAYLEKANQQVQVIACHGQTVRHLPRKERMAGVCVGGSMQLGSAATIAARTLCPVVSDFRQGAIGLGGEGAPVTTGAMWRLFAHPVRPRLVVNIGGMSNYFYLPALISPEPVRASDCGPGNSLSDALSRRLLGRPYDRNGANAARGRISQRLLKRLRSSPFFKGDSRSTGREEFGPAMADRMISFGSRHNLSPRDLLATAGELTARSIADSIRSVLSRSTLEELHLMGGGRLNRFFVGRLEELVAPVQVKSVDILGIDGDLVEAACFAVMGEACLRSEVLPLGDPVLNKRGPQPVLGDISQPPCSIV